MNKWITVIKINIKISFKYPYHSYLLREIVLKWFLNGKV